MAEVKMSHLPPLHLFTPPRPKHPHPPIGTPIHSSIAPGAQNGRIQPPLIRSTDPLHHTQSQARGSSNASSSDGGASRFSDLPPPPTTQRIYLGMRQLAWETWVTAITDCDTHEKIWIGSFHSAVQATGSTTLCRWTSTVQTRGGTFSTACCSWSPSTPEWRPHTRFVKMRPASTLRRSKPTRRTWRSSAAYTRSMLRRSVCSTSSTRQGGDSHRPLLQRRLWIRRWQRWGGW